MLMRNIWSSRPTFVFILNLVKLELYYLLIPMQVFYLVFQKEKSSSVFGCYSICSKLSGNRLYFLAIASNDLPYCTCLIVLSTSSDGFIAVTAESFL